MRKTYFILLAVVLLCSSCTQIDTPLITIGEFFHTKVVDAKIGHVLVFTIFIKFFSILWEKEK